LVLKHRQNGNQHQRIVAFLGSPLALGKEECLALHLALRKNNIALDLVSFGPVTENDSLLETLVWGEDVEAGQAAMEGNEDASHLLRILPGQRSIVEAVASSAVVRGEGGAAGGAPGGFEFGVDPEMDPELALALKLSMEEEQARQASLAGSKKTDAGEKEQDNDMDVDEAAAAADEEDEDALLQQAIALSMQDQNQHQQ
jgi:26S proteasome regulatory subunit N10